MPIDIAIIDKYLINKNKQFHQFDKTAYFFYVIVLFVMVQSRGVPSYRSPVFELFGIYLINFLFVLQSTVMKSLSSFVSLYPL